MRKKKTDFVFESTFFYLFKNCNFKNNLDTNVIKLKIITVKKIVLVSNVA